MRWSLLLLVSMAPALSAQEDEDRTVDGKRASEWFAILRTDKQVNMRRQALNAAEKAGPFTRKIFEEVGSAMRLDSEEGIRAMAARILGGLGAKARDVERLNQLNVKPAIDALIAALSKEKSPRVRRVVALATGRFGASAKEAVPTLGAALKDESPEVRAAAAEALFSIGPAAKDAVKELAAALRDSSAKELWRIREYAARALNRIGRPDALPAVTDLIAVLKEPTPANLSPDERRLLTDVRQQSIEALGSLGDVAAAGVLRDTVERALESKDSTLGRPALTALTKLAGEKKTLIPTLVKVMLPNQDQFMRCEAIHHLGQLGKELNTEQRTLVVENLQGALNDRLSEVRLAAIYALGELGPDVVGKAAPAIVQQLTVLKRSNEKAIVEAATATAQKLQK